MNAQDPTLIEVSPVIVGGKVDQAATIANARKALEDALTIIASSYCYSVKVDGVSVGASKGIGLTLTRAMNVYKTLVDAAETKQGYFWPEIRYQTIVLYRHNEPLYVRNPSQRSLDRRSMRPKKSWNRATLEPTYAGNYTVKGNPCQVSVPTFKGHHASALYLTKPVATTTAMGKPASVETSERKTELEAKRQETLAMFGGRLV
jgi:hypothetical protein